MDRCLAKQVAVLLLGKFYGRVGINHRAIPFSLMRQNYEIKE